jgi:ATP-dependent Clp protease ATP-binding subunit ClpA
MRANATRQQSDPSPRKQLERILRDGLDQLQQRVLKTAKGEFFFDVTGSAKEFLLLKGSEQRYGAQRLKLAIESHVVYPLADLFATDQILAGDMVRIDRDQNQPGLTFTSNGKDQATPAGLPE